MNLLVVGGAGYIGSHVCKRLAEEGYTPITYDNLSTGHAAAVQFGPFVQGDLEDEYLLAEVFERYRPEAVIHLASLTSVRDSVVNPGLYYEKNLFTTLTLLKIMVAHNVLQLIFSSTAAIYGAPQSIPIPEDHPKVPLNAYGKTKWAIEGMLEDFAQAHQLRFVALRYFNACGADPSLLIGEDHHPETHLIPLTIQVAQGVRPDLQIYGADYPTPDGTAIRDYIHVLDLAEAHLKALGHISQHKPNLQVNLGTGSGYSVKQIIEAVAQFSGRTIPTRLQPSLPQDSPILVADPTLAMQTLNWHPLHSSLPTIISTAWAWHEKQRTKSSPLYKFTALKK